MEPNTIVRTSIISFPNGSFISQSCYNLDEKRINHWTYNKLKRKGLYNYDSKEEKEQETFPISSPIKWESTARARANYKQKSRVQ